MSTTSPIKNKKVKLSQDQQDAADAFFTFLFSDEKEMGISGGGGVGKSFLISHLIDDVLPHYYETCNLTNITPQYDSVHMTSLTNKASEVLSVFTGRDVQTIHSFMNLKVFDDFKTGKSRITKIPAKWLVHNNIILFVDECSMIESKLDDLIQEGTHNCKIVYVGDHCQMTPVMEKQSPIYRPGRMKHHVLKQQMRTQIPEIQALHAQLRETVETGIFKPIKIIPGIIDFLDDSKMEAEIKSKFSQQTHDSRILAYTNKRVIAYNDHIRHMRNLPTDYTIGEFLVNTSSISISGMNLSVEEEIEITKMGNIQSTYISDIDPSKPDIELHYSLIDFISRSGRRFKDVPLPADRDHFRNLVDYFRRNKAWPTYFNLKETYPDLRPRDAATVYKAQGSTYETAFVDLWDISNCRQPDQAARMLYVALTREKQRIFLYGQLSEKYGGLIF